MKRLALLLAMASPAASGADLFGGELRGELGLQLRSFTENPAYDEQAQLAPSVRLELEYVRDFGYDDRLVIHPFARVDGADEARSHADLREAYWAHFGDGYELRVGVNKVFWGVAESRHLVDIINQTDLIEDPDAESKLGQPMLQLSLPTGYGTFSGFVLPYFRERTYPGEAGRLRTALPVASDEARYESADEQQHVDFALRYSHYFGPVDLGLSYFDGTNRDPSLSPALVDGELRLVPYYSQIRQWGLDLQYTRDAWLWKLEAIHRAGELNLAGVEEPYWAAVGGFEYTFFGVGGGASDLGVLLEYLYDERDAQTSTPFQNDAFLGLRWALNDVAGSSVLVGAIVDLEHGAQSYRLEAERRLGESWTLSVRGMIFANPQPVDPLFALRRDDYLEVEAVYWF